MLFISRVDGGSEVLRSFRVLTPGPRRRCLRRRRFWGWAFGVDPLRDEYPRTTDVVGRDGNEVYQKLLGDRL